MRESVDTKDATGRLLARVDVQIQSISFRPFQLVHVEVRSGHDWRVVLPCITVKTYLREFFLSFVQKKIFVVLVEGVDVSAVLLRSVLVLSMRS